MATFKLSPEEVKSLPAAESGQRLFATGVDTLLWLSCQLLVLLMCSGSGLKTLLLGAFALSYLLPFFLLWVWTSAGWQTPGGWLAGVRMVAINGGTISPVRNFVRCAVMMAVGSVACFWILFFPALFGERRGPHDYVGGTRVVSVSPAVIPAMVGAFATVGVYFLLMVGGISGVLQPLRIYYIPSGAMENTLQVGDRLFVNRWSYRTREPKIKDIVVFSAPPAALATSGSTAPVDFVKRCVGCPGDVVEIRNSKLWRNGKAVTENFAFWDGMYSYDMKVVDGAVYSREYLNPGQPASWSRAGVELNQSDQQLITKAKPGKIPPDQYLMLGDHRSNSNDSHVWGLLPRKYLVGRVMGVFWPLNRFQDFE